MVLVVPEQSQRPYRFGMTLLCVGALFNWLGLADTYSDPVPAIRYIGVGLIAAGASLICMAMCFWMRNIHDPNLSGEYDISTDPVHVIDHTLEKPPDYSTVVDVPPCYEDAIKLSPAALASVHNYKESPPIHIQPTVPSAADGSDKIIISTVTERCNSFQTSQSNDSTDCSAEPTECRRTEKCEAGSHLSVPNSSQNENALTKVLRKSIRGIRKFRNNEESGCSEQSSNMENGNIQDRNASSPPKIDR